MAAERLLIILLSIACISARAQTTITVDSRDVQVAKQKLQIGTDTSRNFRSIVTTMPASPTQRQAPTAAAVKTYADNNLGSRSLSTAAPTDNNTIRWNGTQWVPSARNLYDIVSANYTVAASLNEVFVDGQTADITLNLPPCNTANNGAKFTITKSGSDTFSIGIDPSGSETFQDGTAIKRLYSQGTSISCTCAFVSGTGKWHFSNM